MTRLRRALAGYRYNPVVATEVRTRVRSPLTPVALTVFLVAVAATACVLFSVAAVGSPDQAPAHGQLERVAYHAMSFQLAVVIVLAAALAAGAIIGERDRGTWELLTMGELTSRSIVAAKLIGVVTYVLLFAMAALPLYVAIFLHAGLGLGQLGVAELLTVSAAVATAALGLFMSAVFASTRIAGLAGCAVALMLTLDVVLSGLVPAPGTGLPQTRAQLLAGAAGVDITGIVTDDAGKPLPPKQERISAFRLANPLYALHQTVTDPTPAVDPDGVPLARVVHSLVPGDSSWSTWGVRFEPWQYSMAASAACALLLVTGAARWVGGRRRRRRPGRPSPQRGLPEATGAEHMVTA
jgi:ABC-2 family transporter